MFAFGDRPPTSRSLSRRGLARAQRYSALLLFMPFRTALLRPEMLSAGRCASPARQHWQYDVMDRLPEPLTTFREFVEADLRRAARLIIKVQDEIDPQFRFSTPEGDYALAATLPSDDYERGAMLRRVSAFMAWKQAYAFMLASELKEPDCVYCLGVSATGVHACLSRIRRHPRPWTTANFGPVEWLERRHIAQETIELLPKGPRAMTPKETAMLHKWFGPNGRFPAVHLPSGELRGV